MAAVGIVWSRGIRGGRPLVREGNEDDWKERRDGECLEWYCWTARMSRRKFGATGESCRKWHAAVATNLINKVLFSL